MGKKYVCSFSWIFTLLIPFGLQAQVSKKKQVTDADFEKWGTLNIKSISNEGRWTSYEMNYESNDDTLYLQSTNEELSFKFPKARDSRFGGENMFTYLSGDDLKLLDLKNLQTATVTKVKSYALVKGGNYVVTFHQDKVLQVRNKAGMILDKIDSVSEYTLNDAGDALVYIQNKWAKSSAGYVQFNQYAHSAITSGDIIFSRAVWQQDGKSVIFSNVKGLLYYHFADKRLFQFDINSICDYTNVAILYGGLSRIIVSEDNEKVFFSISTGSENITERGKVNVEVWNGNDDCIFPAKERLASFGIPKLVVWFPATGNYKILSHDSLFRMRIGGTQDYVLLSNSFSYGAEPHYYEKVDYYLKNIRTGEQKLFLKKQSHDPEMISFSPLGKLILYYRDNDWWLYNPENEHAKNLTKSIKVNWDNSSSDAPISFQPHGLAGWTVDGKYVLLYDAYDIWKFALDGSTFERLTSGREKQHVYRISRIEFEKVNYRGYEMGKRATLDLRQDILLEVSGPADRSTGYVVYNEEAGVRTLLHEKKYLSGIRKSINNCYVFSSETFSQPPRVEFLKLSDLKPKLLFASNQQVSDYEYGKSELIHYVTSNGKELKGALFYPAGYDPLKRYPMIVDIYEKQSVFYHHYTNPSFLNSEGMNISKFNLDGYFVLLPDINYRLGDPVVSAFECVTAAVSSVINSGKVDKKRIGLIGHSFGGYETNFIITQTNMFAAAVSGAGVSDPIGLYFNVSKNYSTLMSDMWRFENQQIRMGKGFYQNKAAYQRNSPLLSAEKIKTPLLIWTGKEDKVVPPEQSVIYYMALRRLGLPTVLLVYPKEGHSLTNPLNQKDLTSRITDWFNFYLNNKSVQWIKDGTMGK